jgi:glyoxylase-like metal-dependent hydrolase (beta-lactamase superfamily II)
MDLTIKKVIVGAIRTNCYIVYLGNGEALLIDPGDDSEKIIAELNRVTDLTLKYILITHGHFDHILALDELSKEFPEAKIYIGKKDIDIIEKMDFQSEIWGQKLPKVLAKPKGLNEQDKLGFGNFMIEIIETPGHTSGGVCYYINSNLFSGDTLFYRSYGRTDLPDSDFEEMRESLGKLAKLPEETRVYPGHGAETTIKNEKINGILLSL